MKSLKEEVNKIKLDSTHHNKEFYLNKLKNKLLILSKSINSQKSQMLYYEHKYYQIRHEIQMLMQTNVKYDMFNKLGEEVEKKNEQIQMET